MDFPEKLRRWREKNGASQAYLAELLNVDRSTIAKWEAGTRRPPQRTRFSEQVICDILEEVEL